MGKELPVRKSVRLKGYDYNSNGTYFITVCIKDGHEMLWDATTTVGAAFCRPQLSDIGRIVENEIVGLSCIYEAITVDQYVIMPNHIHVIIRISGGGRQNAAPTIPRVIGQWKRAISIKAGFSIWKKTRDMPRLERIFSE